MNITAIFDKVENVGNSKKMQIICYPNPTSDMITVEAPAEIVKIEIFNSQGGLVFTKRDLNRHNINLQLSRYIKGVGLISISGKDFNLIKKVFVE